MPYFWDEKGNSIPQENYHALLVQNKSEEDKFGYFDNNLKSQTIVDKLSEDFHVL